MTIGTAVIHKRTRRTGTVIGLVSCAGCILYTRNSQQPRALVQWSNGQRSAMLLGALQVADAQAQEANQQAIEADRIARWRAELASHEHAIECYEERGETRYAENARRLAERCRQRLWDAGVAA